MLWRKRLPGGDLNLLPLRAGTVARTVSERCVPLEVILQIDCFSGVHCALIMAIHD